MIIDNFFTNVDNLIKSSHSHKHSWDNYGHHQGKTHQWPISGSSRFIEIRILGKIQWKALSASHAKYYCI